jgi:Zn-dependent M32 family carboxypeptidase
MDRSPFVTSQFDDLEDSDFSSDIHHESETEQTSKRGLERAKKKLRGLAAEPINTALEMSAWEQLRQTVYWKVIEDVSEKIVEFTKEVKARMREQELENSSVLEQQEQKLEDITENLENGLEKVAEEEKSFQAGKDGSIKHPVRFKRLR